VNKPPITLLGPQHAHPTVPRVLKELGVRGPVAVVSAGFQEREADPLIMPDLGLPFVELGLHVRADDIFKHDKELAGAYKARQSRLKLMQDFYRIRLDHADQAARSISVRHVDPALLEDERRVSLDVVRRLDQDHLDRCYFLHDEFYRQWKTQEREHVSRHRAELAKIIEPTDALVIAGGHVAVLLNRLMMFDIIKLTGDRPIIAWSAGAMALTSRVVLFHDSPPYGAEITEVLDTGLALVPDLVVFPEPRLRLRLDDMQRVAQLAARFAPAACAGMDHGARITVERGEIKSATAQRLRLDGTIDARWP
jgi:hypothetical protein